MYRNPTPPPGPPRNPELDEYEQRLHRSARRKRIVIALIIGSFALFGIGTCFGPFVLAIGCSIYDSQKTKLTAAEAKHMSETLDPVEATAKKSQAAFEAMWPKIRAGEIGARRDLGRCKVDVPGPNIKSKDESGSVSLGDSSDSGWMFVDLAPPEAKSPLATLKMPSGSIAKNNVGTDTWQLPPHALNLIAPDKAPQLDSQSTLKQIADLRAEAAKGVERSNHQSFMYRVDSIEKYGLGVEVVVFVDDWADPKFEKGQPELTKREELDALERGIRPTSTFQSGFAIGRAFAWDPDSLTVACAAQAVAMNSDDITYRSDDHTPLEQDLVLQLERALEKSFVAVGDAPPKLTRPTFDEPPPVAVDAGAPKKSPKKKRRAD